MSDLVFFLIAIGVSLAVSALGFARVIWFISVGYGYSVAGIAVAAVIFLWTGLDALSVIQLTLLFGYGVRLGTYILARESARAYGGKSEEVSRRGAGVGVGMKFLIWIGVAILYAAMTAPAFLPLVDKAAGAALSAGGVTATVTGLAVMAIGIALETAADLQKNAYKRSHPERFCDTGVYRMSRCPNYLGEILTWVGGFVAGSFFLTSWYRLAICAAGLVIIVLIMLGAAKTLEKKQEERYGADPEYRKFASTVPILFPLIPLRSLKGLRVYLG